MKRGVVVLMTCGQSQCKTADVLVALGRKAHENIRRQVAENSGAQRRRDSEAASPSHALRDVPRRRVSPRGPTPAPGSQDPTP